METEPRYQRLPGRAGLFVLHRTYLAGDHLLVVQTRLFLERYRRIYFRDLQGFALERSDRVFFWGAIAFLAAFFGWLIAWAVWPGRIGSDDPPVGSIFWGLIAAAWTVVFVWNLALGPGCTCRVRTAVQTIELASLNRLRRALRARQVLLERVTTAQGSMESAAPPAPATDPTARVPGDAAPSASAGGPRPAAGLRSAPPALAAALQPGPVQAVAATALGSALASAGVALDYVQTAGWAVVVMLLAVLAALSAVILQFVLGRSGRLPARSRNVGLGVIGVTVLGGIGAYVSMMAVLFENLAAPPNQFDLMMGVWRLAPGDNRVVDVCYVVVAALYLVVAVAAVLEWVRVDAARRTGIPVDER